MKLGLFGWFLEVGITSASEFFMLSKKPPNCTVILVSMLTES